MLYFRRVLGRSIELYVPVLTRDCQGSLPFKIEVFLPPQYSRPVSRVMLMLNVCLAAFYHLRWRTKKPRFLAASMVRMLVVVHSQSRQRQAARAAAMVSATTAKTDWPTYETFSKAKIGSSCTTGPQSLIRHILGCHNAHNAWRRRNICQVNVQYRRARARSGQSGPQGHWLAC